MTARPEPRVHLVGAGPGDADLLTLKAARLLRKADIVLHDSLISPEVLALADRAERVDVGKRCGRHATPQAEICRLLVAAARAGQRVVRLKGGDPMVFGRATEEMEALAAAGIAFGVVPGVTAALAAAASAKISLTRRGIARTVTFLTGHGAEDGLPALDWAALVQAGGTLAVYMGRETLPGLASHLIESGMRPSMPAMAIENISLAGERALHATLGRLPALAEAARFTGPVLVLIGPALAQDAAWRAAENMVADTEH